jgi:sphingolipid C9-methyltransferase
LPAEGPSNDHFSNLLLVSLLIIVPWWFSSKLGGGLKTWIFFALLTAIPILMAFWTLASSLSPRKNDNAKLPGKPIENYLTFKTEELREKYSGRSKIPMETFHELYFKGLVDFNGDALNIMEYRHDWANFRFTLSLFWFFLTGMMPEVIMHTKSQGKLLDLS